MVGVLFMGVWLLGDLFMGALGWVILVWVAVLLCLSLGVGLNYSVGSVLADWFVACVLVMVVMFGGLLGLVLFSGGSGQAVLVWVLLVMLFWLFVVDSWFGFYVAYEGSLVPLVIGVVVFGGYYERLVSVVYLVMYMLVFSTPLVVAIVVSLSFGGSVSMGEWDLWGVGFVVLFLLSASMLVKVPMFGVHSWLPKVHVEAPVWGSVVLAAVMIKMGVYGLWRLCGESFWESGGVDGLWLWALLGVVVSSAMCVVSSDVKVVVAYSSVVHMGGVLWLVGWFLASSLRGVLEVVLMHGLISGGLFMLLGGLGDYLGSRSVMLISSFIGFLGFVGLVLLVGVVFNMGFPVSGSMLGELEVFCSVVGMWRWGWVVMCLILLMVCAYNLYLYVVVCSSGVGGLGRGMVLWALGGGYLFVMSVFCWVVLCLVV